MLAKVLVSLNCGIHPVLCFSQNKHPTAWADIPWYCHHALGMLAMSYCCYVNRSLNGALSLALGCCSCKLSYWMCA